MAAMFSGQFAEGVSSNEVSELLCVSLQAVDKKICSLGRTCSKYRVYVLGVDPVFQSL